MDDVDNLALLTTDTRRVFDRVKVEANKEWGRLKWLQRILEGRVQNTWAPNGADLEYKDFMRKSMSPWLMFASECFSDALIIDGFSDERVWSEAWEKNGMSGKQHAINKEACAFGYSYLLTFPDDQGGVIMRPLSVHRTFAFASEEWDEEPEGFIYKVNKHEWRYFDDLAMYKITKSGVEVISHDLGVCPISIIPAQYSADSFFPDSLVSKGIPAYKRVVDATFTLKMGERYGAFPQKYQSGGVIATDDDGNAMIRPSVDSLLHSEDYETRFGSFAAMDLSQITQAVDEHLQHLAAILHVPPHYLLGKVVNLSSEALAATETGFIRKLHTAQESLGEGYERALRIAAQILGDTETANDYTAEVHWQDVTVRTLASSVDAVQKLSAVGAPNDMIFQLVPGFSKKDALNAAKQADKKPAVDGTPVRLSPAAGMATGGQKAPHRADINNLFPDKVN